MYSKDICFKRETSSYLEILHRNYCRFVLPILISDVYFSVVMRPCRYSMGMLNVFSDRLFYYYTGTLSGVHNVAHRCKQMFVFCWIRIFRSTRTQCILYIEEYTVFFLGTQLMASGKHVEDFKKRIQVSQFVHENKQKKINAS